MPTITIDGQPVSFEGKKYILQVAQDHGIELPHYCYHPGLSVVASCRICLAEVAQPNPRNGNKLELIPKLMPTCQTPAVDGMAVYTTSPKALANQKAVMEYLLINHPLDCPVCDKAGECRLQDYSVRYGRATSRFQEDKIKKPVKDLGPHVKLYADRCIMCSRCVRFTREVTGTAELCVTGRGCHEQIDIYPGRPLCNELSGNVVDLCPVGALVDKDFLFAQRVWFLEGTPSIDGLTASGDNISIHHNEGRIFRVRPRTNPQVNTWWISDEIRYGWKFIHHDQRLHTPQRLQYGSPINCTWDRALADAASALKRAATPAEPVPSTPAPASPVPSNSPRLALLVSPMLACEQAYLLAQLVRGLDPQALIGVGPIPTVGQDKTFPGGYCVLAEKCPNSRGVRRALELVAGATEAILKYEEFCTKLADKKTTITAILLTGGYPPLHPLPPAEGQAGAVSAKPGVESTKPQGPAAPANLPWAGKELTSGLSKKFLVLLDILPGDLATRADVLLPTTSWAETAGTFENHRGLLQSFDQAIPPLEGTRPAGQIALDLLAAAGLRQPETYDAAKLRQEMGGVFATDVKPPAAARPSEPAETMVYVEL